MHGKEMPFNFIQQFAVRVDDAAADFAFQVEMFPALCFIVNVLITGAAAVVEEIFANLPRSGKFFQMPVDGSLPNGRPLVRKMAYQLIHGDMTVPKGTHILKNVLSLPGMIICRAFMFHHGYRVPD
jgi:hypothetical protein